MYVLRYSLGIIIYNTNISVFTATYVFINKLFDIDLDKYDNDNKFIKEALNFNIKIRNANSAFWRHPCSRSAYVHYIKYK